MALFPQWFRLSSTSRRRYRLYLDSNIIGGVDYSLTEQATGLRWIDGKEIFTKTVAFPVGPNNGGVSAAHGIVGLSDVVSMTGYLSNGSLWMALPNGNDATAGGTRVLIDDTLASLVSTANFSSFSGHLILTYTKS
jgi:hypothetical protein